MQTLQNYIVFYLFFVGFLKEGSHLRFTNPGTDTYNSLPLDVINIRCRRSVVIQVKGRAHVIFGLQRDINSTQNMYRVILGIYDNSQSCIRLGNGQPCVALKNAASLSETEFRPFWVSWERGVIALGSGEKVGKNEIVFYKDPSPRDVNHMAIDGYTDPFEWILEDAERLSTRLRYELIVPIGLYTPDTEPAFTKMNLSQLDCLDECLSTCCRTFNFNVDQGECRIYNITASGWVVENTGAWKTWVII